MKDISVPHFCYFRHLRATPSLDSYSFDSKGNHREDSSARENGIAAELMGVYKVIMSIVCYFGDENLHLLAPLSTRVHRKVLYSKKLQNRNHVFKNVRIFDQRNDVRNIVKLHRE